MSAVYFISDLHVTSMQDKKAQILLRFLISLRPQAAQTTLFFGGDIFDMWLGAHTYFIEKFQPLIDELKNFLAAGGTFHYFEGNHDLHLKKFWQDEVGGKVHSGPELFLFDDKIIRFEHGDQMDPEDRGYIFLRWLLRTWLFRFLILNVPGFIVAFIGRAGSRTSRVYTNSLRDEERILKKIHDHAHLVFEGHPFDAIISGHVHLRDEYHFQIDQRLVKSFNLGSWDDGAKALKLENGQWSWIQLENAAPRGG